MAEEDLTVAANRQHIINDDDSGCTSAANQAIDICKDRTSQTESDVSYSNHSGYTPPHNWQANKKTVKERLAFLFNSEILSDVHFIVGQGEDRVTIPAHRFVLSVGSAVFDAMFHNKMTPDPSVIELPDIEATSFLALLKFLYTDELVIEPESVMTILYTAKKYAVMELENACVNYLKSNICSENAFLLLSQARLFDEPQLANMCLEAIDKNTSGALSVDNFTEIDLATLTAVLERNTLRIGEAMLFKAVQRWAEVQCERQGISGTGSNQRQVLGKALSLIRFPLMTLDEFASGAATSGLLTDRECVELFLYFTTNTKPQIVFQDIPRYCFSGSTYTLNRFTQIESRWGYSGTCDRISFKADRRIVLLGIGLYGSFKKPAQYEATVEVIETSSGKMCFSTSTSFQSDGSSRINPIVFKEPVEIIDNFYYTISAFLDGPDSYYGTKGKKRVIVECYPEEKVMFEFFHAAGNNNGTSTEDGQIPEIAFFIQK